MGDLYAVILYCLCVFSVVDASQYRLNRGQECNYFGCRRGGTIQQVSTPVCESVFFYQVVLWELAGISLVELDDL